MSQASLLNTSKPSFTFVSTANPIVLRGATPVLVDINISDLNIDVESLKQAITSRTKAVIVVHYAGIACNMRAIMDLTHQYNNNNNNNIHIIEDAAHAYGCRDAEGRLLGSIGSIGCFSFHHSKNIVMGEGGALVINDTRLADRARILCENGTNKSSYHNNTMSSMSMSSGGQGTSQGKVGQQYEWVDVGTSSSPPETSAAILAAQLDHSKDIHEKRLYIWNRYWHALAPFANNCNSYSNSNGNIRKNNIVDNCQTNENKNDNDNNSTSTSNHLLPSSSQHHPPPWLSLPPSPLTDPRLHTAHIFWILLDSEGRREAVQLLGRDRGIGITRHYVPLHISSYGRRVAKTMNNVATSTSTNSSSTHTPPSTMNHHTDRDNDINSSSVWSSSFIMFIYSYNI